MSHSTAWLRRGVVVVLGGSLLLCGCGLLDRGESEDHEASTSGSERLTFDAGQSVRLEVRSGVGAIRVQRGTTPEVVVEYTKTAYADSDKAAQAELAAMTMQVERQDDRAVINTLQPEQHKDNQRSNKIDLVLTVPENLGALDITQDVGDVRVEGVSAAGAFRVINDVGQIVLDGVNAPSNLLLSTDVGEIRFSGTIGTSGSYDISTDTGAVTVELPASTSASIEAQTGTGAITVNGLSLSQQNLTRSDVGAKLSGMLGEGGAALTVRVGTGAITLRQS